MVMVNIILKKDVTIKNVTVLPNSATQALGDPVRIKILEVLSHKQMSADEISKALSSSGYKKATTTIRHHLDMLKTAGLIEVSRMVEVRGAVMKYYAPTLRAYSYNTPDLEKHSRLIEDTSNKLLKIHRSVLEDKKFIAAFVGKEICSMCKGDHYKEYVALEILNLAIAKIIATNEYIDNVIEKEHLKK